MQETEEKSAKSGGEKTVPRSSDTELLYKTLFNQSPDGVLIIDPLGNFLDFNDAAHLQLGYSREEFEKLCISDIDPVEKPEEIQGKIQNVIKNGGASFEVKHRTKAGDIRNVYVISQPLAISGRTVLHAIWRDITEQKRAEEALREANVRLEALIQAMPDLVFFKDAGGRHVLVNKAVEESTGIKTVDFIGKRNNDLLPPDKAAMCNRSDEEAVRKGGPIHADEEVVDPEGRKLFLDTIKTPVYGRDGSLAGLVCVARDVTDRRKAEEALQRSEEKFRTLYESANDAILVVAPDGAVIDSNSIAYQRLGYAKEEFLTLHVSRLHSPAFSKKLFEEFAAIREQGNCVWESEHVKKDGTIMPVEVNARMIAYDGKEAIFCIARDITSRKKAEEARIESEKRFHALFDNTPLGVVSVDTERHIIDCNAAFQKMIGYSMDELKTMTIPQISQADDDLVTRERYRAIMNGEIDSFSMEKRHLRKDGSTLWANLTGTVIRDQTGKPRHLFGIIEDIGERKLAEESLLLFRNLLNQSKDAIFVNDPATGRFLIVNDMACKNLGYSRNELLAMRTLDVEKIFPNQDAWDAHVAEIKSKGSLILEGMHKRRDGTTYPAEVSVTYMTAGGSDYMVAVARDISERKQAEQALRKSEERLSKAQKMAHVGNWEMDLVKNELSWSEEVYRIYGVDPARFVPTFEAVSSAMHPDDLEPFLKAVNAAINGRQAFEMDYRLIRPDGAERTVHTIGAVTYDAAGRPLTHSGTVQDITERKRTELALRDSEERLRSLFESSPVSLWLEDLSEVKRFVDGLRAKGVGDLSAYFRKEPASVLQALSLVKVIDVNEATLKLYGAADKATFLTALSSTFTEESFIAFQEGLVAMAEGRPSVLLDTTTKNLRGDVLASIVQWTVVPGSERSYSRVVVSITDVTDLKRAGAALHESEERFRNILQTVDDGFLIVDRDYRIVSANRAYAAQVNLPLDKIIGRHCYELSHRSQTPCYETGEECAVRRCFETGLPSASLHKHADSDGSVMYVETKSYPLRDATGAITSAIEVIHNTTDRHLLEEQILRTQKLEAVGILAGGIAHDFNNLLQGVFGSISLAKTYSERGGKAYEMLEGAESALYQATSLTKQLLTFSKGGEPVKKVLALPSVVDDAVKFALSGSNIRYRSVVDERLRPVEADEGQLNQVIHNIVLNACDAMPDGGIITTEMHNVTVGEHGVLPLERGDYVSVEITDSGTGIPNDHLSKIFDPYFTTKPKGSGLGLATAYSIVKKHGGALTVRSQPGAGSTFNLYLPASTRALSPEEARVTRPIPGKGRILVMDDEEIVRTVARHMLDELGYEISLADNGEQALEQFSGAIDSGKPFDAVILDLTVRGGMGGKETLKNMASRDPSVKAIVSSGYSSDDILSHYKEYGFQDVLIKPYEIEALSRVLHKLFPEGAAG